MNQSKTKLGENTEPFQILVEENGRFYRHNYFFCLSAKRKDLIITYIFS